MIRFALPYQARIFALTKSYRDRIFKKLCQTLRTGWLAVMVWRSVDNTRQERNRSGPKFTDSALTFVSECKRRKQIYCRYEAISIPKVSLNLVYLVHQTQNETIKFFQPKPAGCTTADTLCSTQKLQGAPKKM